MTNIACIGAGYWGKNLIRNFHQLGVLRTICDASLDVLKRFSEEYPEVAGVSDVEQVLTDQSIEAVSIATPAETHYELIKRALIAGKHVYVEKPLCLREDHAQECIALAESKGLTLMVGHLLWYHPMVLEIQRAVQAGELGLLRYIYSNRLNMGLLRSEENVLWSFAPHDISMILGIVGSEPISVSAQGASHLNSKIADQAVGLMKFAGNVSAHVFVSWLNPFKEQKLVVVGELAMMVFDDTLPWEKKLAVYAHSVEWQGERPVAVKAEPDYVQLPQSEPLKNECQHFVDSVSEKTTPRTDGNEGLQVLTVLNKLQHSMDA
ncbi:MAG: UDP-2-acetamido-3-amino-2,3-dideoxy-glucuronate N-acetyltransferase [Patiriisocius sp.]|jgi:UDP-2-acetamido-3-amino-2,3-dideoxy-glucuronate N-acetyltransferase